MAFLISVFFAFAPTFLFAYILYWLDRYEKEPLLLLGAAYTWGAVIAAGGALVINTIFGIGVAIFTGSEAATELTTGSLIAPIVEESLKGLAVLCIFLLFRKEFDSIFDGMLYAGITALGFAATENVLYFYSKGYLEGGWEAMWAIIVMRVVVFGWMHPFFTAFTGIGLAISRLNRNWAVKILAPIGGLIVAMFAHSLHNTMAELASVYGYALCLFGTLVDWSGWLFMFGITIWALWREQTYLRKHLAEEVNLGTIDRQHFSTASSAWLQMFARIASIFDGKYFATARFYQACGELAHKKEQLLKLGDESGNTAIIQKLRGELAQLGPRART
jgi:RsiW-degrading membrane proteinase PrsW (M82 family)